MSTGDVFLSVSSVGQDSLAKRMLTPLLEEDDDELIDTTSHKSRSGLIHPEFDLGKHELIKLLYESVVE